MATFCLIHGNWHDSSSWDQLVPELRARGHEAVVPNLPIDDPATTYEERVRPALGMLEGTTGPIVVLGHSAASGYAAIVASRVPASLLVYLCPRLEHFQPTDARRVFRETLRFPPRRADGTIVWEPEDAIAQMYSRLDPGTAAALADNLRPTAPPSDEFPLRAHPDVETVVVYATEDEFFEPEWERFIAREIGADALEIGGGHFPMAEDPRMLGELLDRLARERTG
ncbi:MAG: alpha/beta fold hydrolase [Solirubrobacterales bacterium]